MSANAAGTRLQAWRLLCALLLLACTAAWAQTERRVALVIGNNNYASAPLLNPVNDARAMATALQAAGFAVILKTEARQADMLAAVRDFGNRLREGGAGTVGLFYFAGHGMQIRGRNFLIPVGANIEHEDEVSYQGLDAQAVLDKMESAGNGVNVMILDACRNNPFARSFRSSQQGLAAMDAPVGTLVAFATSPGSVASDGGSGSGNNGLYTTHLLNVMRQPGMKVEDVFKQVRSSVRRESLGRQVPMEWSSLEGDFYFTAPRAAVAAAGPEALWPDPQAAIDDALWSAVKDSSSSAEVFAYLNRFPLGRHARQARARLNSLSGPAAVPAAGEAIASASGGSTLGSAWPAEAAQQREIALWGSVGTDRRPAKPERNAHGFAEGDRWRWRWRLLDQATGRPTGDYTWRIDSIAADGSLWVNDGAQRLDARGQLRGGNDENNGLWVDWLPALPVAETAGRAAAAEQAVSTVMQRRDAEGRISKATLAGTLQGPFADPVETPAGKFDARRVHAHLTGPAVHANGERFTLTLSITWWLAPGSGLPVLWELEERVDDRKLRRVRHELIAVDMLKDPPRLAGAPQ